VALIKRLFSHPHFLPSPGRGGGSIKVLCKLKQASCKEKYENWLYGLVILIQFFLYARHDPFKEHPLIR
jgi:hypothetical protein